jgi:hypothetical protein
MATLTGKTIGELTALDYTTNNLLIPVEESGTTYHIAFSGINYTEGTYSGLTIASSTGGLVTGQFYLMTDFQTCYDQPNYESDGTPITTGNYKTGTTEPILLLAISTTGFSPTVYSTLYPQDKISYDITWDLTEVTSGSTKGRITERVDDKNNRADYDFRSVQFIRYVGYFSEQYYTGKINLDGATGLVTASQTGTTFTNDFTVGDIFGVYTSNFGLGGFQYYEISSILSNTQMYVTGRTLTSVSDTYYSAGQRLPDYMSPYQCNITGTTNDEFDEYYTFNNNNNFNTYLGDNVNYSTFILSNNVFLSGSYRNNTFGGNVVGNTLNDDMDSNMIGPYCQYNIITNDFDRNIIGSYFQYNIIDCDMESNQIDNYFQNNMLGDADAQDFDFNRIGSYFSYNFLTFNNNDFINNNIGDSFNNNLIDSGFRNNTIVGDFYQNLIINQSFNDNSIGDNFYNNTIPSSFYSNNIGDNFNTNTIYFEFRKNSILNGFNLNTIGGVNNSGLLFENNQIMNNFKGNDIQGDFTNNNLKTDFKGNDIFNDFSYNNAGYSFLNNTLSGETSHNNIGDYFQFNNCEGTFQYNTIGTDFYSNEIQDGFGFGGSNNQGNRIGNYFYDNIIGEYFYNNTIPDNFYNNSIGDYFQWNIVDTYVDNVDFTTNYGNISGITYVATGSTSTDGSYSDLGGTTNGNGVNSTFNIEVSGGTVTGVTINDSGKLYVVGNTITILGSQIGGTDVVDDVIITVAGIEPDPSVYELYTCNIFKNSNLTNRLSYYDGSDTLTIKDINQ